MEDRYEIRGKIGQGGLGAVYRAYDTRMNREVAIKRILVSSDDKALETESTRQLAKEAGALASLQHPHIVTVYDVGNDEDGPFVVMELLSGKSIDELISRAPMTWEDFHEFALQTQEALIAAQDLHMVHRDLKPANIMLNWLPSGKFQVKIVDFGLAKLSPKPSLQTLDHSDSVFGSIFFMAPEQFERVPLDARTDMYAIGCVYYYALTGFYPFDGDTGPQVMAAHLQHTVRPLQEVRSEIPMWLCDWIMWHLNRMPDDRPSSARESLRVFLENDAVPHPPMSTGTPLGVPLEEWPYRTSTHRVRPAVPNSHTPANLSDTQKTQTAPQPLLPPEGSRPSVHTSRITQRVGPSPTQRMAVAAAAPAPTQPAPTTQPPLKPTPAGPVPPPPTTSLNPHRQAPVPTSSLNPKRQPPVPTGRLKTSPVGHHSATLPKKQGKKAADQKSSKLVAIIAGSVIALIAVAGFLFWDDYQLSKAVAPILTEAAIPTRKEISVNSAQINSLLKATANKKFGAERLTLYRALLLAKSTDATDIDRRILQFISTDAVMPDGVRENLVREVLRKRNNISIREDLINFAGKTKDREASSAALQTARMIGMP